MRRLKPEGRGRARSTCVGTAVLVAGWLRAATALAGTTPVDRPPPPATPAVAVGANESPAPARTFEPSGLREPPPRPVAEVRVQNQFAHNAGTLQLFGGIDYLERRDFYVSPGVRVGATYFLWESLGIELQVSHYFSRLNQAGLQVEQMVGVIPDSRAPTWLVLAGGRYAMGYGKMMIGGLNHVIHFQPQAFLQAGMHVHDGSFGPSALGGIGLLVHATPRWFVRLDGGMTFEVEQRVTGTVAVLGFLPSLVTGGFF
jgi:hypothetical protein